jgi:phosphonate transport system substrate-binding protein
VAPKANDLEPHFAQLSQLMKERLDVSMKMHAATSYEALANDVREAHVDVAWLPPIVFLRLEQLVSPLGSILRGGKSSYEAALIVRAESKIRTIDALRGTRAGWVDPWSASGFIWQRVKLALMGVDPRELFRTETFHGSHRNAIQALRDGACDVAGTYSRMEHLKHEKDVNKDLEIEKQEDVTGSWSKIKGPPVYVLARFAGIPSDVIAVRNDVASEMKASVLSVLRDACSQEQTKPVVQEIFGGDDLREGSPPGYEALKTALDLASLRGLFD